MPKLNYYCLIINVRNGQAHLEACLNSLCNQSLGNYEIFIFDNQSEDHTAKIIENYKYQYPGRINYIYLDEYLPINKARNYALSYIKKNFDEKFTHFSFTDADDIWDLNWLKNIDLVITENSIVYTNGYIIENDKYTPVRVNHIYPKYSFFSSRVFLQGTVVPFSLWKSYEFFDENIEYCIDVDKWNELFNMGVNFIHVSEYMFYYRVHGSSLSSNGFTKVMLERWYLTKKYKNSYTLYFAKLAYYIMKHVLRKISP